MTIMTSIIMFDDYLMTKVSSYNLYVICCFGTMHSNWHFNFLRCSKLVRESYLFIIPGGRSPDFSAHFSVVSTRKLRESCRKNPATFQ